MAYPRFASDGAILLQCDCGKILKVPSSSNRTVCPVCGEPNAIPSSLSLPVRQDSEIPEVLPIGPDNGSPPLRVQWDNVFTRREQGASQANDRLDFWSRMFGRWPLPGRRGRTKLVRSSAKLLHYTVATLALIAIGLTVMGIMVYFIVAFFGTRDTSVFK